VAGRPERLAGMGPVQLGEHLALSRRVEETRRLLGRPGRDLERRFERALVR
jgi:hypothetical protein